LGGKSLLLWADGRGKGEKRLFIIIKGTFLSRLIGGLPGSVWVVHEKLLDKIDKDVTSSFEDGTNTHTILFLIRLGSQIFS